MLRDFRDFVNRGNVIDLAVGVIIGAAFSPIVRSLVDHVVMPPIGLLLGGVDFSEFGIVLRDAEQYATVQSAIEAGVPVLAYGIFVNAVVQFLITAFVLFLFVRFYSRTKKRWERKQEEAPEEAPAAPRQEALLAEIRDLLAQRAA